MLRSDYLVLTVERTERVQAAYPVMLNYWLPEPKPYALYGFRGLKSGKVFVGESEERVLVQATGPIAHDIAMRFPLPIEHALSVARLDVQATFVVPHADRLIALTTPSSRYKATRYINVNEPGSTLYVGAPSSDVRLRIYNKTAESGIKPDQPGEFLRVELQYRNRAADVMFRAIRARAPHFPWLVQVKRMLDTFTYSVIEDAIREEEQELFVEEPVGLEDSLSRRKTWIERSVIPAVRRVLAEQPDYRDTLIRLIDSLPSTEVQSD